MQIPEHLKKYLSPAQLQQLQLEDAMSTGQPVLTFEEWYAQKYGGQPQQPQQSQMPQMPQQKSGWDFSALEGLVGGGAGNLAATPAENAAWNAAGMEATGAPMSLMDAAAVPQAGMGAYALPAAAAIAGIYGLKQGAFDGYKSAKGKTLKDALKYQMSKPSSWVTPAASIVGTAAGSLLGRESIGEGQRRHTQQLLAQSDDPTYQAYVSAMREQFKPGGAPDPSKPFAGKYGSWGEYEKAGLEAGDLTGVMGNIESFGPNWSKLNFDQQKAVTQALIDAKQYESKKGEVLVKDQNKAREIYDTVSKGGFKIPTATTSATMPLAPTKAVPTTPTPIKRITF